MHRKSEAKLLPLDIKNPEGIEWVISSQLLLSAGLLMIMTVYVVERILSSSVEYLSSRMYNPLSLAGLKTVSRRKKWMAQSFS